MITGINHSSFTVSDLDVSVKYYKDILGMKLHSYSERPTEYVETVTGVTCSMKVAYLNGYGLMLELIEYVGSENKTPSKVTNIGCGHICFNVENMGAIVEEMAKEGVEFLGSPTEIPAGTNKGGYVIYALDPDGIVTEFIQPPAK